MSDGNPKDRVPTSQEQNKLIATVNDMNLTYTSAIKILRHRQQHEEEVVQVGRQFKNIPWADSALAIQKAMAEVFHWAAAKEHIGGFFDPSHPPRIMQISCGPNGERVGVPIGDFQIPMLDDAMCHVKPRVDGLWFSAELKRKWEVQMNEMLDLAEQIARTESLYRGKALRFERDPHKDPEDETFEDYVSFMKLGEEETLILPESVEVHLQANLWTPIEKPEAALRLGVPLKRALLMYGRYGVGKTLAAHRTAHVALANARTFIYVPRSDDLPEAYEFADQVSPAVLFVEDIDRIVKDPQKLSVLANVLDGVTSKGMGVYLVATTNHIDEIPPILLRPGRFDMHLELIPPDEKAIQRLIALYAPQVEGKIDRAVKALEGQIPAIIRECCERAKLYALTRGSETISGEDLYHAAGGMTQEMERIAVANTPKEKTTPADDLARSLHHIVHNGSAKTANGIAAA